ncbi:MmgE/PrpD family protein [Bosea sp. 117]|uniref:MmgE/PrpD family protein n=1 Tax=Bosea sp. 117 TaxID=1125973 RepID=UPI000690A683|nr:MmgE/PrpD family protein [Bosea sp. 117]
MSSIAPSEASAHTARTTGNITDAVAAFAAGLAFEAVPERVVHRIRLHLIDTLGCAVAGRDVDLSGQARAVASRMGGAGTARVFGSEGRFSPTAAAFANAVIANALDFDDGFEIAGKGMGHPGSSLVPAALAALGPEVVSGRDFLLALVAAYEVNNRLILAMQPSAERFEQVYGIAQHQAIGAALAHGRLSGLDGRRMRNALGLAGALTPLPSLHKYNWLTRPIISLKDGVAPAAQAGVQAVMMSEAGFVGSVDMLDGPQGYWRMIGSDRFDASVVTGGLGAEWFAARGSFKLYPACRWLAPALEAFEAAFAAAGRPCEAIASVDVASFGVIADKLMECRPANAVDAQFSLPFTIAALATGRAPGPEWFAPAAFADPAMRDVATKVRATVDPEMDRLMNGETRLPSARVAITFADGSVFAHHVGAPLGGEARAAPDSAILDKAARNLHGLDVPADRIVRRLLALEAEPDVRPLMDDIFTAAVRPA